MSVGNANASMRDFAAAADVRLGHLQHYYPTRADLIRAVLERALQRSLERVSAATKFVDEVDTEVTLTESETARLFHTLLAEHDDPSCVRMFMEIWGGIAVSDKATAAVVRDFYTQYVGHITDLVSCVRPELDRPRCSAVAAAVVSLLEGAAVVHSSIGIEGSADSRSEIVRSAVALVHGS